ncbi:MAG TPA: SLBB domain-containing protein [Verrucomicrobiae bacterium]|jgi:hypothetical protein|nr:SLBB domain-containing protein [Verrucomicrobiae bacterium]
MRLSTLSLVAASAVGCSRPEKGKVNDSTHHGSTWSEMSIGIFGEVSSPGKISLPAGSHLSDAIPAAGGFTDSARKTLVTITKASGERCLTNMKNGDLVLENGETVYIHRRIFGE